MIIDCPRDYRPVLRVLRSLVKGRPSVSVGWILLKKSLSRISEEYSVLGQFICARMIRIGYVARTIIS